MFTLTGKWYCAYAQWCIAPMAQSDVMCSLLTREAHTTRRSRHHARSTHHVPHKRNTSFQKRKSSPLDCFRFWLRRWDLNLTTSGLWARRATKLLYSAIWFLRYQSGAGDRDRTGTILSYHGILSPGRLPVPPHRHLAMGALLHRFAWYIIAYIFAFVNSFFKINWKLIKNVSCDSDIFRICFHF